MAKGRDASWKNVDNWAKGKERLKHGNYQHPEEDPGNNSVFNYMKNSIKKRKELHIMPFKQYENMGKTNEDMLAPVDSPSHISTPLTPGQTHQTPQSMPTDMDPYALVGPSKNKEKSKKKKKEKKNIDIRNSKVLRFDNFVQSRIKD